MLTMIELDIIRCLVIEAIQLWDAELFLVSNAAHLLMKARRVKTAGSDWLVVLLLVFMFMIVFLERSINVRVSKIHLFYLLILMGVLKNVLLWRFADINSVE